MTAFAPFDLFTIGHSNHSIDDFLALVARAGVTAVADVRSVPFSRRYPWFSASRLSQELARAGTAYVPLGDQLGGRPRAPDLLRDGIVDYGAIARTSAFRAGLDRVTADAGEYRVCLMCAEREPLDCHRCLLVARALAERGLAIGHVLADGTIEPHAATEARLLQTTKTAGDLLMQDHSAILAEAYRRRARAVALRRAR